MLMAAVWIIDVVVIVVQIMAGRRKVNPVLRWGLWVSFFCLLAAGVALVVGFIMLLQRWLLTLR